MSRTVQLRFDAHDQLATLIFPKRTGPCGLQPLCAPIGAIDGVYTCDIRGDRLTARLTMLVPWERVRHEIAEVLKRCGYDVPPPTLLERASASLSRLLPR